MKAPAFAFLIAVLAGPAASAGAPVSGQAWLDVERIDSRINKIKCTIDSNWPCPKINDTSVSH